MRVSVYSKFNIMNHYSGKIQEELAKSQVQLATGKKFNYASEDPIGANQAMLISNAQDRVTQLQKNVEDANSFLERGESILGSTIEILQSSREKALEVANGTVSDKDRKTYASIVDKNIDQVLALANTKYLNRYIFSGEKTNTEAFSYDGTTATYNGDTNNMKFNVSSTFNISISETGDVAFQDVLDSLIKLRDSMASGSDSQIESAISGLDGAMDGMIDLRSEFGTRISGLDTLKETYEQSQTDLKAKKSVIQDADITEVVSKLALSQQLYQGTIQASTKMLQTSILNYI